MKIRLVYILVFSLSLLYGARGQITIDSVDMPSIGDTIIMGVDTMPSISSVGDTGMQTWDFTALQIHELDTTYYVDPASTTNGSNFPNSNLAILGAANSYQTLSGAALTNDGYAGLDPFGQGLDVLVPYTPAQILLELPATDGSSFAGMYGFDVSISTVPLQLPVDDVDSVRLVHNSDISSVIDAYGTIMLPGGDYDAIRQLYTEESVDSIFVYCSNPTGCPVLLPPNLPYGWSFLSPLFTDLLLGVPNPIVDTSYNYKWFTNGEDLPIAWVETDLPGGTVLNAGFQLGYKPMGIISAITDATCAGSCDADATVSVINGTPPFTYVWNDPMNQSTATATGLCAGSYSVFIIDAIDDTSAAVNATVGEPAALGVTVTSTPDSGNADGVATATVAGGTGTYTYAWSNSGNTASITGLAAGPYTVTITDVNGCVATETATVATYVGAYNLENNEFVLFFPNPANSEVNIQTSFGFSGIMELYDLLGKKIRVSVVNPGLNRLNTTSLNNGIYLAKVFNEKGELVQLEKLVFNK